MKAKLSVVLGVILGIVGIVVCVLIFEVYEEEVDHGWNYEARRNPFLAMQKFLQQTAELDALVVTDDKSQLDLVAEYDTVFISDASLIINQKMFLSIKSWLEQGGHLIVGVNKYESILLEELELSSDYTRYEYQKNEDPIKGDPVWIDESLPEWMQEIEKQRIKRENCEDCDFDEEAPKLSDMLKEYKQSQQSEKLKDESQTEEEEPKVAVEKIAERRITTLRFNDLTNDIRIAFSPFRTLEHPSFDYEAEDVAYEPFYWQGTEENVYFAQFSIGEGMVTATSDPSIWNNHFLGRLDHAYLLNVLGLDSGRVLIMYGLSMPSLLTLFYKYFPEFCYMFAIALALWIWRHAWRVGRAQEVNVVERRSAMESIAGMALFRYQNKQYKALLDPVRREIFLQANKFILGFANANRKTKSLLMHKHTKIDQNIIEFALFANGGESEDNFVKKVKALQKIRDAL